MRKINVENYLKSPNYACGEHSITYRDDDSLYCIPETNVNWVSPVFKSKN